MNHAEFSAKGGKASAKKMTKAQRKARAAKAAKARWAKPAQAKSMVAARERRKKQP